MIPQDIDDDHDDCESRWLTETLETLMKERAADEQKAESQKLKQVFFWIQFSSLIVFFLCLQNNLFYARLWRDTRH